MTVIYKWASVLFNSRRHVPSLHSWPSRRTGKSVSPTANRHGELQPTIQCEEEKETKSQMKTKYSRKDETRRQREPVLFCKNPLEDKILKNISSACRYVKKVKTVTYFTCIKIPRLMVHGLSVYICITCLAGRERSNCVESTNPR